MTLALGDALSVALMRHRRFTPADFREFHPGGKLGAQLTRVRDLMHKGDALPLVPEDTPMGDALLMISSKGFGVVGVTNGEGRLAGVITDGDLRRHMDGLLGQTAGVVMTAGPRSIRADALAAEAVVEMTGRAPRVTCLFVLDEDDRPEGILHIHDCLRAGLG
jgi:arabinose-5-phosphate isomerase